VAGGGPVTGAEAGALPGGGRQEQRLGERKCVGMRPMGAKTKRLAGWRKVMERVEGQGCEMRLSGVQTGLCLRTLQVGAHPPWSPG
jgi:hypothetical protein